MVEDKAETGMITRHGISYDIPDGYPYNTKDTIINKAVGQ
jgi:hypothetical protein